MNFLTTDRSTNHHRVIPNAYLTVIMLALLASEKGGRRV